MENKSVKNKYGEQNENKYAKTTTLEIFRSLKKITCIPVVRLMCFG